jgi:hypothetical protein
LNHHFHGDNEHAWKVEDVVVDQRFCELIHLGAPIRVIFVAEEKNKSKQKVEGKGMMIGEHREQELKRMPDLVVRTVRAGKNRARDTPCNGLFASRTVEVSPGSVKNVTELIVGKDC